MSPASDIGAFRDGRWKIEWLLAVIQRAVEAVIDRQMVFDFLAPQSCLGVVDADFRTVDLFLDLVKRSDGKAVLSASIRSPSGRGPRSASRHTTCISPSRLPSG